MVLLRGVAWRLARLLAMPGGDRWRLVLAGLGLPLNAFGVRVFGLQRWMRLVGGMARRPDAGRAPEADMRRAWQTGRVVAIAARHAPYQGNCLSRSLTLWWLLLGQGIHSDLRIGVARPAGQFEAHAWIEYQGVVINDQEDVGRRYSTFDRPINSAARFV
jgi:transglutaminase superfamily protein